MSVVPRVERGEDDTAHWWHVCAYEDDPVLAVLPTDGPRGWRWTAGGGLSPSILCHNCGTHGFWDGDPPSWRSC